MKQLKRIILGLFWILTSHAQGNAVLTAIPSTVVLAVNNPGLSPVLTGRPRDIRIENNTDIVARNVKYISVHLPQGMSITPAKCGDIKPKEACVLSITPGLSPSENTEIHFKGDNTSSLSVFVRALTYGSVYQGGYVFAIEDNATRVSGKVLSLRDQTPPVPGVVWSSNGRSGRSQDAVFHAIPQVYDDSLHNCDAKVDGACNTARIVDYYSRPMQHIPIALKYYAAGVCKQYVTNNQGETPCSGNECLADWYLPAICEFDKVSSPIPQSIICPADIQNVVTNLGYLSDINCAGTQCLAGSYWSSTAHYDRGYPEYSAWDEDFNVSGSSQYNDDKNNQYGVRCVRAF